jgi:hypothetical protein
MKMSDYRTGWTIWIQWKKLYSQKHFYLIKLKISNENVNKIWNENQEIIIKNKIQ